MNADRQGCVTGPGARDATGFDQVAVPGDGQQKVSLDKAIKIIRETGADPKTKHRETARGGRAVSVI